VAARLTDMQKKQIVADYVEIGSYNAVAKMHGVSDKTVKSIVESNSEFARISEQKKEQNTQDMLAFMDSRKERAQEVVDTLLSALMDPVKIEAASLNQIATSLGIVVDKFTKNTASGNDSLSKLDGLLEEFKDAVKSETD
jgi:transposase-like protein